MLEWGQEVGSSIAAEHSGAGAPFCVKMGLQFHAAEHSAAGARLCLLDE